MGRKRWWRGGLELFLLCVFLSNVLCDGNVGCLFSEGLCQPEIEICYNDLAFGRCLEAHGNLEEEDLYTYDLRPDQLELLRERLEKLAIDGYRWPHPFTQCIIQHSLLSLRFGTTHDRDFCSHLKRERNHFANDNGNDEDNDVHSQELAIVKFTPSNEDPHGDYADELYYPPEVQKEVVRFLSEDPYVTGKIDQKKSIYQRSAVLDGIGPYRPMSGLSEDVTFLTPGRIVHEKSPTLDILNDQPVGRDQSQNIWLNFKNKHRSDEPDNHPGRYTKFKSIPDEELEILSEIISDGENFRKIEENSGQRYDTYQRIPPSQEKGAEDFTRLEFLKPEGWVDRPRYSDSDDQTYPRTRNDENYKPAGELYDPWIYGEQAKGMLKDDGIYTEGGLVRPSKQNIVQVDNSQDIFDDEELDPLSLGWQLAGFKRRERLDVKKPGPPFTTNNYAFKTPSSENEAESTNTIADERKKKMYHRQSPVKKELNGSPNFDDFKNSYKNVDMDHVYLQINDEFHTWSEGQVVVEEVGRLLGIDEDSLTDIRVGRAEVTFKIKPQNTRGFNASDILNKLTDIREQLQNNTGIEIVRAGIGDKVKLPATHSWEHLPELESGSFKMFLAAGLAAAGAAAAVTLLIAKRHAKSRSKLAGLSAPDPEASKDYQDLCRVRMQAKQPTEKPDSPRIANLSRESESNNSPSSRSSTSSWSEEPALSNMDISTGHMVLSYMEDHLKNKDRLDQEWTALCAYEAEPSSTAIAEDEENVKRNRTGASLPYDHSRVVLNDLANINNSDYINASTITDHDPRNPAYIATQGALPQTAADFWQLVWEQGSVVIVMLTRLTEEGQAMCHRYWPDEGSELYHIYEVHLVSEHIWCDDYLVRSFYLKNLRTGETRTVTQFHFLSWPENGVPHSTKALLEFRRKVNKSYRGRSCPIVVHCSDGAGRTGTYCLIDMVLNRMAKGAKEIDIAATLEHIRDQRPGMVATKQQFEFVLMAVAEEVHAILKALPIPPAEKSPAPTSTNVPPPGKPSQ